MQKHLSGESGIISALRYIVEYTTIPRIGIKFKKKKKKSCITLVHLAVFIRIYVKQKSGCLHNLTD